MFCVECGRDAPCGAHPDGLVCVSVSVYSGINRDVVHSMKYSSRKAIALMMGENMARSLPNPGADFLVPIPLHKGGEREYNQAALIAKGASRVWNVPVKDCVRWSAERGSQASSRGKAQRALPPGAMISDESAAGKNVILVDDVCTTGNTLLAAAGALEAAGANPCGAMVWGRSM
jgi:predicted amidophosphoribosyltransferase